MAFVDLNKLPFFGFVVQRSRPEFHNMTTTEICRSNTKLLEMALESSSTLSGVYNLTFGETRPVELPDLFSWVVPHDDARSKEIVLFSVLTAAALLTVVFRIWTSVRYLRRISATDWSIIIGMVLTIGYIAVSIFALEQADNGKHVWDIRPAQFGLNVKLAYILQIYIIIAFLPVKMAFLLFYATLSDRRAWRIIIGVVGLIVALSAIAFTVLTGIVYTPGTWFRQLMKRAPGGVSPLQGAGIVHLVTDVMIYFLPIPMLAKFDFGRVEKAIVFFVFIAGGVAIIASAMRMVSMVDYGRGHDFTYTSNIHLLWTIVQLNTAIICVAIPGIRPMLVSKFPQLFVADPEVEFDNEDDEESKASSTPRKSESAGLSRQDSFQPPAVGVVSRVESRGGSDLRDTHVRNNSGIMVTYTYDVGSMIDIGTLADRASPPPRGIGYIASANASMVSRVSQRITSAELPPYDGPTAPAAVLYNDKGVRPDTPGLAI